jgi:hypothetical protein
MDIKAPDGAGYGVLKFRIPDSRHSKYDVIIS